MAKIITYDKLLTVL